MRLYAAVLDSFSTVAPPPRVKGRSHLLCVLWPFTRSRNVREKAEYPPIPRPRGRKAGGREVKLLSENRLALWWICDRPGEPFARVAFSSGARQKERPSMGHLPYERPIDAQLSTSNVSQDDRKIAAKLESPCTKKKPGEGARQAVKRLQWRVSSGESLPGWAQPCYPPGVGFSRSTFWRRVTRSGAG
jgi:hypothetical protein